MGGGATLRPEEGMKRVAVLWHRSLVPGAAASQRHADGGGARSFGGPGGGSRTVNAPVSRNSPQYKRKLNEMLAMRLSSDSRTGSDSRFREEEYRLVGTTSGFDAINGSLCLKLLRSCVGMQDGRLARTKALVLDISRWAGRPENSRELGVSEAGKLAAYFLRFPKEWRAGFAFAKHYADQTIRTNLHGAPKIPEERVRCVRGIVSLCLRAGFRQRATLFVEKALWTQRKSIPFLPALGVVALLDASAQLSHAVMTAPVHEALVARAAVLAEMRVEEPKVSFTPKWAAETVAWLDPRFAQGTYPLVRALLTRYAGRMTATKQLPEVGKALPRLGMRYELHGEVCTPFVAAVRAAAERGEVGATACVVLLDALAKINTPEDHPAYEALVRNGDSRRLGSIVNSVRLGQCPTFVVPRVLMEARSLSFEDCTICATAGQALDDEALRKLIDHWTANFGKLTSAKRKGLMANALHVCERYPPRDPPPQLPSTPLPHHLLPPQQLVTLHDPSAEVRHEVAKRTSVLLRPPPQKAPSPTGGSGDVAV